MCLQTPKVPLWFIASQAKAMQTALPTDSLFPLYFVATASSKSTGTLKILLYNEHQELPVLKYQTC